MISLDEKPFDGAFVHLHVKAYVRSHQLKDACNLIHSYEERNLMPPLKTYSLIIGSLLAYNRSHSRALAWDMFAHMRYVAHPVPDAQLYAKMLKACADAPTPQAERALDLFVEMRTDYQIPPTREAYNSVILACAKCPKHSHDAFQLAQEMLELFRSGHESLKPNRNTFNSLLECAKRNGDLRRARRILYELIRAQQMGDESFAPDNSIMANVFHTYAAYEPPSQSLRQVNEQTSSVSSVSEPSVATLPEASLHTAPPALQHDPSQFDLTSADLPLSHKETLVEASRLFEQILLARDHSSEASSFSIETKPLYSDVLLTTQLLNAFLSVVLAHSSLSNAKSTFDQIFHKRGVPKSDRSYRLMLERCAYPRSATEKRDALRFARSIWDEWTSREKRQTSSMSVNSSSPRTI